MLPLRESSFEFIVPHSNISSTYIYNKLHKLHQTKPLHIEFTHPCIALIPTFFVEQQMLLENVFRNRWINETAIVIYTNSHSLSVCADSFFIYSIYQFERPKPNRTAGIQIERRREKTVEKQTTKIYNETHSTTRKGGERERHKKTKKITARHWLSCKRLH